MDAFDMYLHDKVGAEFDLLHGNGVLTPAASPLISTNKIATKRVFVVTEMYCYSTPNVLTWTWRPDGKFQWTGTSNRFTGRRVPVSPTIVIDNYYELEIVNNTGANQTYEWEINGFYISKSNLETILDVVRNYFENNAQLDLLSLIALEGLPSDTELSSNLSVAISRAVASRKWEKCCPVIGETIEQVYTGKKKKKVG